MSVERFGPGGVNKHHQFLRDCRVALLIGCASIPAAAGASDTQPVNPDPNRPIVVVAAPLFQYVTPERQFGQDAIDSYAVSTIDELLGDVQVELGDEAEQPLIFVNGKRINSLSEIGALPVEALKRIQVLPRGSAVARGGTAGQRVIDLTLKDKLRSATVTAADKLATDGDYHQQRGEGIVTNIKSNRRFNVTLRARRDNRVLESDRGIVQPTISTPFAIGGNLVGYPNFLGEIDPSLSGVAGQIVTAAPIPAGTNPTLGSFAGGANRPAATDLGQFRSLRPATRNYDLNATYASPILPWLDGSLGLHLNRGVAASLRGLASSVFVLRPTNPASPFSRSVGLAYFNDKPLHSSSNRTGGELNLSLNATFGSWNGSFNGRHEIVHSRILNERLSTLGVTVLPDSFNPFGASPTTLMGFQTDRVVTFARTDLAQLVLNGPLLQLPAGPLSATVEGRVRRGRIAGNSSYSTSADTRTAQNEQAIRAAFDVPITSRESGVGSQLGDLSATAEFGRAHFSTTGTVGLSSIGVTWQPRPILRLHAAYEQTEEPAAIETLGGPVFIYNNVRVFDPLTGQTVDVTQISGGNPALKPQNTKIKRVSALLRLVPKINLQLNAEYIDSDRRNFVSPLPEASAAVMQAFPDRYLRDGNGNLAAVDLRPVNFASDRTKQLRWGFSLNAKVEDGSPPVRAVRGMPGRERTPNTNFQLTASHSMVFSDRIVIRDGLDRVDLLNGGAIGIGGGRLRHQIDGTAALTRGGTGIRAGVTWRGASSLIARFNGATETLRFSPVMLVNVKAFTDLKQFLPRSDWAKGFRLSLDAINLTNDRQRVADQFGDAPLQYQPGYRDPLGRTIELELRKAF